jgi:hypothetical protein
MKDKKKKMKTSFSLEVPIQYLLIKKYSWSHRAHKEIRANKHKERSE